MRSNRPRAHDRSPLSLTRNFNASNVDGYAKSAISSNKRTVNAWETDGVAHVHDRTDGTLQRSLVTSLCRAGAREWSRARACGTEMKRIACSRRYGRGPSERRARQTRRRRPDPAPAPTAGVPAPPPDPRPLAPPRPSQNMPVAPGTNLATIYHHHQQQQQQLLLRPPNHNIHLTKMSALFYSSKNSSFSPNTHWRLFCKKSESLFPSPASYRNRV